MLCLRNPQPDLYLLLLTFDCMISCISWIDERFQCSFVCVNNGICAVTVMDTGLQYVFQSFPLENFFFFIKDIETS